MHKYKDGTFEYYKDQLFKILGLFENQDKNAFKFAIKILYEMEKLPYRIPSLDNDHRCDVLLNKVDILVDEMFFLEMDNHWLVKNLVFESMNLLDEIKEGL